MRKMSKQERKEIESYITHIMADATGFEYARHILESRPKDDEGEQTECTFMDSVVDDVMNTSAWEEEGYYNDDDIRLAIGRVFMDRLDLWY